MPSQQVSQPASTLPSRLLYGATVFSGAFLLFLVEPLAAKQLLPILGGSSAVWLTCLVFFQLLLLLGYLYAHILTTRVPAQLQRPIHQSLLILAALTLLYPHHVLANASERPIAAIFLALTLSIGLPFLLLASTSPLLQVWLARRQQAAVQYRLFALSNAGSFLALLAYPAGLEPHLTLTHQTRLWIIAFDLYAFLAAVVAADASKAATPAITPDEDPVPKAPPATLHQQALWFFLPLVAAMQLTAITGHLTRDIAAIPLLWVLPLGVYLLTFVTAFGLPRLYHRGLIIRLLIVMLAALGYTLSLPQTDEHLIFISIAFFLLELFVAAWFCHAETYALRPSSPAQTTRFYLLIAAGGVTGTFFVAIASPLLFSANYDVAIAFTLTALAGLAVTWREGWSQRLLWTTSAGLLLFLCIALHIVFLRQSLVLYRNFYSSLRVEQTYRGEQHAYLRTLLNGYTTHGTQLFSPELQHTPTTYYTPTSGIGIALARCCKGRPRNIGVIGLGAGTLAAYGRPGDTIRFYEINPAVRPIAEHLFTYLRDSPAHITYAEGDARLSLAAELAQATPQHFDVLVIDAFTGDAIPLHLLTREAMQLYLRHLAPGGILAFHTSNRFLNLAPAIANLAADAHLAARLIQTADDPASGQFQSEWVLVTSNQTFLADPQVAATAIPLQATPTLQLWTDDYSTLLPILKWH